MNTEQQELLRPEVATERSPSASLTEVQSILNTLVEGYNRGLETQNKQIEATVMKNNQDYEVALRELAVEEKRLQLEAVENARKFWVATICVLVALATGAGLIFLAKETASGIGLITSVIVFLAAWMSRQRTDKPSE